MAKNQVTGRVTITLGGMRLASKEGAKLMTGGVDRDEVLGDGGVIGFSEKTVAPGVECTIAHKGDTSLKELNETTNATLIFDTDSGRQYILRSAWLKKPCELDKGEVPLSFGAITCEEL